MTDNAENSEDAETQEAARWKLMGCENCVLERRVDRHDQDIKDLHEKINQNHYDQGRMITQLINLEKLVEDMKKKIDILIESPGKRWDKLVNAGIASAVSFLISLLAFLVLGH